MSSTSLLEASFRDPAGYVFQQDGRIKRMVTSHGIKDYRQLVGSGLHARLTADGLLIPHEEEPRSTEWPDAAEAVLRPETVPFISYPYEWSFSQLRDAALLTLGVQEQALAHGMTLKDASAFNVQFRGASPVFIDTLSFTANAPGPWPAYSQFCRHFLAPLLMVRHIGPEALGLLRSSLDGVPLDFASAALPRSTWFRFGVLVHIHMHVRAQRRHSGAAVPASSGGSQPDTKKALIASLRRMVESLELPQARTTWSDYYGEAAHYSQAAHRAKQEAVGAALDRLSPKLVYDLGANTGVYSRLATARGAYCISFDLDPMCVERNYREASQAADRRLLPLVMDLGNPSPGLGFAGKERMALDERPRADLLLALALIHHLRISANVPFVRLAEYLARLGRSLVIEWVPKDDPKVAEMLRCRPDTFHDYDEASFAEAFSAHFRTEQRTTLPESGRSIYMLRSRQG